MLQGVGKSFRGPLATLYIDDAVDKRKTGFYMGIVIGTAIFGPALGFLLGGLFSKIYVTLERMYLNNIFILVYFKLLSPKLIISI